VRRDIDTFFDYEFRRIVERNRDLLKGTWPTAAERLALADLAAGLFISAATAVKFIDETDDFIGPRERLGLILGRKEEASEDDPDPFQALDIMYTQILESAIAGIPERRLPKVIKQFKTVIGTIVLAYGRLSPSELASLFAQPGEFVTLVLSRLHSVILVPKDDGPVRAFHLSFHDYITDKNRCTSDSFYINPSLQHAQIARFCLGRMMHSLKRDICGLCDALKINNEINALEETTAKHLPGDLRYACRYWGFHLSESCLDEDLVMLTQEFLEKHVLHWIEALSLIGALSEGMKLLGLASAKLAVSFHTAYVR
jgi:hypothetical protein